MLHPPSKSKINGIMIWMAFLYHTLFLSVLHLHLHRIYAFSTRSTIVNSSRISNNAGKLHDDKKIRVHEGKINSFLHSSWKLNASVSGDDNNGGDSNLEGMCTDLIEAVHVADSDSTKDTNDRVVKIRFRGRVTYNGSGFSGWQVQAKGRTCQGELENVLSTRFNRTVKIVGAGRTDTGVHARGQAFHFDVYPHEVRANNNQNNNLSPDDETDGKKDNGEHLQQDTSLFCRSLQKSLNSMLSQDMRVYNICRAPPPTIVTERNPDDGSVISTRKYNWHVIYAAEKKLYTYRISLTGPHAITNDPLQRYTRVHVNDEVNVDILRRTLAHYEGTHDFRAFAGAVEANQRRDGIEHKDTVRTVYNVTLVDEGGGEYRIDILLKGALYKMVRNMVGTALEVAKGRMKEEDMLKILHHDFSEDEDTGEERIKKRQFVRKDNRCKPAPAEGLTMEMVYFDDGF